jgi:hypothetical protein
MCLLVSFEELPTNCYHNVRAMISYNFQAVSENKTKVIAYIITIAYRSTHNHETSVIFFMYDAADVSTIERMEDKFFSEFALLINVIYSLFEDKTRDEQISTHFLLESIKKGKISVSIYSDLSVPIIVLLSSLLSLIFISKMSIATENLLLPW